MKLLFWIATVFIVVFAFFGLLMCIEYLKYWKRKIVLELRLRLNKRTSEVVTNDD